jgi:hypothetical protein
MKNKRQINGRRFVFALAAAELELRKREGWQHRATSGCLEKLVDIGYECPECGWVDESFTPDNPCLSDSERNQ